jgi:hypothetical protein
MQEKCILMKVISWALPEILFKKIEDSTIDEMKKTTAAEPVIDGEDFEKLDPITIDEFFKTDLRVAEIVRS